MPVISVIMVAHNAAPTIEATLGSIAASRDADWEAVVVDDGSTDATGDILARWSRDDPRFRVLTNAGKSGLAVSLNRAIEAAAGRYLARIDADDIVLPRRFAAQAAFLDARPGVGIVGTGSHIIDGDGVIVRSRPPVCPTETIDWAILWRTPFVHPSVMIRRQVLDAHGLRYDEAFPLAQDYEFWTRLLRVCRGANLDMPGILYRVHQRQSSSLNRETRLDLHRAASGARLAELMGARPPDGMLEAQRWHFLGERARGDHIPSVREAIAFRQTVFDAFLRSTGDRRAAELGFGTDLWRAWRGWPRQVGLWWMVADPVRRRALLRSGPWLAARTLRLRARFFLHRRGLLRGADQGLLFPPAPIRR